MGQREADRGQPRLATVVVSGLRTYPRVPLNLVATLVLPNGKEIVAPTKNVSCAGFQASVGPDTVECLFPQAHQPPPRLRTVAAVTLCGMPGDSSPGSVQVRCAAVVARRVAESEFHVGFQFLDLPAEGLQWLEAHMERALREEGPR